jgi:hypothetical protein
LDAKKRKQFFAGGKPPIELGAVLDTTCRNCGGRGKKRYIFLATSKTKKLPQDNVHHLRVAFNTLDKHVSSLLPV